LTLYLTNVVGRLAVGRLWKGDLSPSFLKKYFPAVAKGAGRVLVPQGLVSLFYSWPTIPTACPHCTCLALSGTLYADHVDGLDGLLRTLAIS